MVLNKQIIRDLQYLFLLIIVLTLPFSIKLNSITIILFSITWLIEGNFKNRYLMIKRNPYVILFLSFYIWILIGVLYSSNIKDGFKDLEQQLSLFIFPLLLSTSRLSKTKVFKVLLSQICSVLIAAIICMYFRPDLFFNFKGDLDSHAIRGHITAPIGMHQGYFSLYIVFSIFVIATLISTYYNITIKLAHKFILVLIGLFLFYVLNILVARAVYGGLFMVSSIIFFLFVVKEKKFKIGILGMVTMVLLFLLLYTFSPRINYFFKYTFNANYDLKPEKIHVFNTVGGSNLRIALWTAAWETYKESNWLFGTGTGDGKADILKSYEKINFNYALDRNFGTHNQYIDFLVKLGLIGLIILILQFIIPLNAMIKKGHYLYIAFLLLIMLYCLTENVLNTQKGVVFFSFFNSLLLFNSNSLLETRKK